MVDLVEIFNQPLGYGLIKEDNLVGREEEAIYRKPIRRLNRNIDRIIDPLYLDTYDFPWY